MDTTSPANSSPFLSVFKQTGQRLRRMAARIVGNDADAEDVLQDAFCRLWPRVSDMQTESHAQALLTTTVRHLSIDHLRQRKAASTATLDETDAELSPMAAPSADEAAEREERFKAVERIIESQLSPLARDILHRHEYQGESFETIAAALDMQPAAVRMQLSRARKTIRNCYKASHQS